MENNQNSNKHGTCDVRSFGLAIIISAICIGANAAQDAAQSVSRVEGFKGFLSHRPIVESITFLRKMPASGGMFNAQSTALMHGRWDSESMFYLQFGRSAAQIDKVVEPNVGYIGRSNDLRWKTVAERLVSEALPAEKTGWYDWPMDAAWCMREVFNDVLNMSLPRVKPGSVVWKGDDFDAEVDGGNIHGRLILEGESPKSITFQGVSKYLRLEDRFRIDYSYAASSTSPMPDRMQVFRQMPDQDRLIVEISVQEFKQSDEHLVASLFDGQRFVIPRWDTLLTYSNRVTYYHPPGVQSRELVAVKKMSKSMVVKPRFQFWYFIFLGALLSLPGIWLAGRKLIKTSSQNTLTAS